METIGYRIKKLRKEENISQDELAFELKVSRQTISKWENDTVKPDIDSINLLCIYFNITSDYLINGNLSQSNNKSNFILYAISLIVGIITIIGVIILLIFNKGNDTPSSTINISYEVILLIIGIVFILIPIIIYFKNKHRCK